MDDMSPFPSCVQAIFDAVLLHIVHHAAPSHWQQLRVLPPPPPLSLSLPSLSTPVMPSRT